MHSKHSGKLYVKQLIWGINLHFDMTLIVNPPPRWGAAMGYLASSTEVVLFGGKTSAATFTNTSTVSYGGVLGDTWVWNNTAWANISPGFTGNVITGPGPRYDCAGSFDGTYFTIVGGSTTAGSNIGNLSDTWSYNTAGGWAKQNLNEYIIPPNGGVYNIPTTLTGAKLAYLSGSSESILVGGAADQQNSKYCLDTWTWTTGVPATGGSWVLLNPPAGYVGVKYPAFASSATVCVMFGGLNYNGAQSTTYTFNGTSWTQITGFTPGFTCPPALYGANMVYDTSQSLFYLFGGITLAGTYSSQLWSYSSGSMTWTNITPTSGPSARAFSAFVYNASANNSVLFSGLADRNSYLQDTWILSAGVFTAQ
jgi:hypothetical protein